MTISRTWRPWVAGTVVLAIALVAGVTGWQMAHESGDGGEGARNATVAEPIDSGGQDAETGSGDPATNRPGTERSGTGDSAGGSDAGNPVDISELAGEGEDHGPAEPSTGDSGTADPGSDDLIVSMPELDWTELSRHFQDELDCPSGRRTSTGDCFVFDPDYEPRFVPGDAPRPDEAGSGF